MRAFHSSCTRIVSNSLAWTINLLLLLQKRNEWSVAGIRESNETEIWLLTKTDPERIPESSQKFSYIWTQLQRKTTLNFKCFTKHFYESRKEILANLILLDKKKILSKLIQFRCQQRGKFPSRLYSCQPTEIRRASGKLKNSFVKLYCPTAKELRHTFRWLSHRTQTLLRVIKWMKDLWSKIPLWVLSF